MLPRVVPTFIVRPPGAIQRLARHLTSFCRPPSCRKTADWSVTRRMLTCGPDDGQTGQARLQQRKIGLRMGEQNPSAPFLQTQFLPVQIRFDGLTVVTTQNYMTLDAVIQCVRTTARERPVRTIDQFGPVQHTGPTIKTGKTGPVPVQIGDASVAIDVAGQQRQPVQNMVVAAT